MIWPKRTRIAFRPLSLPPLPFTRGWAIPVAAPCIERTPVTTLPLPETAPKNIPTTYAKPPGQFHFWLRRVHSLMGLVFGGYITVHLLVNASGFWPKAYQQNVDKIHSLEPMLPLIEIGAIFLPLLIHVLYGFYITWAGVKFNTTKYQYGGNVRYFLQRMTAMFLLAFIIYHVGTLHKWGFALIGLQKAPAFDPDGLAYQTTAKAIRMPFDNAAANAAIIIFYLLGIWSATFHFANGLWTSAIAWGLTITRDSQRRWGNVCFAFFIGLTLVGTAAWVAFGIIGDPNVPKSETQTMPEAVSRSIHAQATNGQNSKESGLPGDLKAATQPK